MLAISQLSAFYGPIQALRDISVQVEDGEAVAVLGPNGAGKSTLLHSISGLVKSRGRIEYEGTDICGATTSAIVKLGIVQVPEGRRIFTQMTVLENLMLGAYTRSGEDGIDNDMDFVFTWFPDLAEKRARLGGELSGGQQQMLAIGRALMCRPRLLLLDEPSLGLSPIMCEQVAKTIAAIRKDLGTSILLVEQNAGLALELASRVYVMETGRIALSAASEDISMDEIRQAYLGHDTKQ